MHLLLGERGSCRDLRCTYEVFVIDIGDLVATEAAWLLLELLIKGSSLRALVLWLA